ncbi:type IVB secretion system protein IcmH/DotU [Xenophilus aerolatus]|nr:type IVB secretion system protein IcmH/DotU [Xenophilus aerolatus]
MDTSGQHHDAPRISDCDFFDELQEAVTLHPLDPVALKRATAPRPPPKPLLQTPQVLVRQSPQPDRLVAVRAAPSPLLEAAGSLLDELTVLTRVWGGLEQARADTLRLRLVSEISSFQSICQDAQLRYEHIVVASYGLCTALDEAACNAMQGDVRQPAESIPWIAHPLAVQFHGDSQGGRHLFVMIAKMIESPQTHADALELMLVILRLGFTGMYGHDRAGRRHLDEALSRVRNLLIACRRNGPEHLQKHWEQMERYLADPSPQTRPSRSAAA